MSEWGNPPDGMVRYGSVNQIALSREPGELKHLSSPRKRKDSASSGERKRRSPQHKKAKPKVLERNTRQGESPVGGGRAGDEYGGAR